MADRYPQQGFTPPPGATRVTLVRHGQSQAADPDKPFPLVDGHGDPPLTDLGHRQADAVAGALGGEAIDAIYVSSLTRTHQTAAPLVTKLGIEPAVEADLREIFLGDWEGGLFRKYAHEGTHPAIQEMRRTGNWGAIPGAETNDEFRGRCEAAVGRIAERHPDQHTVCFVHGGVIGALLARATGGHIFGTNGSDNGSIHRLVVHPERWFLRGFNITHHLDGVATPPA